MTQANQADLFGEGVVASPRAPQGNNRPTTPDGLFFADTGEPTPLYWQRIQAINQATNTTRTAGVDSGRVQGDGRTFSEAVAGGGYQEGKGFVDAPKSDLGTFFSDLWRVPAGVAVAPVNATLGQIGPIENSVRGLTRAAVNAPGEAIKEAVNNPLRTVATGGLNTAFAFGDRAFDDIATGVVRDVGGNDSARINAPLTPGQLYQPNGPLYSDSRREVNIPGIRDIGRAIGNIDLGGIGSSFGFGGAGGGTIGGGTGTGMATPQYTQQNQGAISADAQRIIDQAQQFYQTNSSAAQGYNQQAQAASQRAAPQMAMPSSANQQAVYDRAMNFQADTSGAQRLEGMQMDMQGIGNLESWSPGYSQQGVNNLEGWTPANASAAWGAVENFNAAETGGARNALDTYEASNTLQSARDLSMNYASASDRAASALHDFNPYSSGQDAESLRNFQSDRSGINRLNAYADAPEGPSAAQAMLSAQSDADKRTALAIARSGRGGPAATAQAQRQAISEGAAIAGETRGQASVLRAQETDMYKQRQLQALAQAGSLISAAEAQRLQGLAAAGQLTSQSDQMKLQALQAYAQVNMHIDSERRQSLTAAGQLNLGADTNRLGAIQTSGQMAVAQDQMRLSGMQSGLQARSAADAQGLTALSNAASLRGQMDGQQLQAISSAANLRTQADQIRSNNLQAAGNIRIQGSGQQLQALSLAGQVSSDIRSQDIQVLRSNLDAQLQTLGLNDNQVRFFTQLGNDRELAGQNMVQQANALGLNATQAQQALDLQWAQFGFNQLTTQQQQQLQQQQFQFNQQQAGISNARANRQEAYGIIGGLASGIGSLFGGGGGGGASGGVASSIPPLPQVPQLNLTMPQYNYTPVSTNNAAAGSYQGAGLSPLQLTQPNIGQGVGYQPTPPQVTF